MSLNFAANVTRLVNLRLPTFIVTRHNRYTTNYGPPETDPVRSAYPARLVFAPNLAQRYLDKFTGSLSPGQDLDIAPFLTVAERLFGEQQFKELKDEEGTRSRFDSALRTIIEAALKEFVQPIRLESPSGASALSGSNQKPDLGAFVNNQDGRLVAIGERKNPTVAKRHFGQIQVLGESNRALDFSQSYNGHGDPVEGALAMTHKVGCAMTFAELDHAFFTSLDRFLFFRREGNDLQVSTVVLSASSDAPSMCAVLIGMLLEAGEAALSRVEAAAPPPDQTSGHSPGHPGTGGGDGPSGGGGSAGGSAGQGRGASGAGAPRGKGRGRPRSRSRGEQDENPVAPQDCEGFSHAMDAVYWQSKTLSPSSAAALLQQAQYLPKYQDLIHPLFGRSFFAHTLRYISPVPGSSVCGQSVASQLPVNTTIVPADAPPTPPPSPNSDSRLLALRLHGDILFENPGHSIVWGAELWGCPGLQLVLKHFYGRAAALQHELDIYRALAPLAGTLIPAVLGAFYPADKDPSAQTYLLLERVGEEPLGNKIMFLDELSDDLKYKVYDAIKTLHSFGIYHGDVLDHLGNLTIQRDPVTGGESVRMFDFGNAGKHVCRGPSCVELWELRGQLGIRGQPGFE